MNYPLSKRLASLCIMETWPIKSPLLKPLKTIEWCDGARGFRMPSMTPRDARGCFRIESSLENGDVIAAPC